MGKSKVEKVKKKVALNIEKVKQYADVLKLLGEAFQSLMGRKPLRTKVAVLSSPENPKSMSVLTRNQAKFVGMAYYVSGVEEWGGLFDGLKDYADELMETSPSIGGLGREQVISFIGAIGGEAVLKKLGISIKEGEAKTGD